MRVSGKDVKKRQEQTYTFDLYGTERNNGHLACVGREGSGKAHLFHHLIQEEHSLYPTTTSFVLCMKGQEEYEEILGKEAVEVHQIGNYTINPFADYQKDLSHTIAKVVHLLHSVSKNLAIQWTEGHTTLTTLFIEHLLEKKIEVGVPTLQDLYRLANNGYPITPQNILVYYDVLATLKLFMNEDLPLKRMFNGQTNIPAYAEGKLVILDGKMVLSGCQQAYLGLFIEYLYKRQSNRQQEYQKQMHRYNQLSRKQQSNAEHPTLRKIAFYQDGFAEFFEDPCYKYLYTLVAASSRPAQLGLRVSFHQLGDLLTNSCIRLIFGQFYLHHINAVDKELLPTLRLPQKLTDKIQYGIEKGQGIFIKNHMNQVIFLDNQLTPISF